MKSKSAPSVFWRRISENLTARTLGATIMTLYSSLSYEISLKESRVILNYTNFRSAIQN